MKPKMSESARAQFERELGVPVHTYYLEDGTPYFWYIRISETPEASRERLMKWMYGQTMPIIDGMTVGDWAIYADDYYRFINNLPVVD